MSVVVDLEVENLIDSAKKAQAEIERLEKQILDLRKAKLDDVSKEVGKKLTKEIALSTVALKEQRIALRQANVELKNRAQALNTAGTAQQQFRSQVGASNAVALEFNRIIQDAPFGIIGVGNNIQQLTANFAQLRAGSASTGAALKASLLSIVSPANLVLLGVSALTSLWTAYQLGVFESKEETVSFREELEKFVETLDGVQKATVDSTKASKNEIQTLSLLRSQAENTNIPLNDRIKAVNEIQKTYPSYLGNLTQEQILTGNVGSAYKELTNELIRTAKARALGEQIGQNLLDSVTLLIQEEQRSLDILEKRAEIEKLSFNTNAQGLQVAGQFTAQNTELVKAQEELNDLINQQVLSVEKRNELSDKSNRLQGLINGEIEKGARLTKDSLSTLENLNSEADRLKRTYEKINELPSIGLPKTGDREALIEQRKRLQEGGIVQQDPQELLDEAIQKATAEGIIKTNTSAQASYEKLKGAVQETGVEIQKLYATEALGGNPFAFLIDSIFKFKEVKGSLDDFADGSVEKMQLLREQAVLTGNIFSGLGDTFASVFASGNRELGQFISALGDFIGQLVVFAKIQQQASAAVVAAKQTEATAAGISAAAQTAAGFGPKGFFTLAPLIASAVALVGSAFRGLGGARNTGGRSSANSSASLNSVGSSFAGFGASANPFGDLTLRASIRGTDIELLLERTTTKSRA